jgi:hypothetical protein
MGENNHGSLPLTLYLSGSMERPAPPGWTGFVTLRCDGAAWVASTRVITLAAEVAT